MDIPDDMISSINERLTDLKTEVREGFGKQGAILDAHTSILESHNQKLESHSRMLESHSQTLERHDLGIRRLEVLMEQMDHKIDLVIEGLQGLRESVGFKLDDHEKRITILERS